MTIEQLLAAFFLSLLPYFELSAYGFTFIMLVRSIAGTNKFVAKITKYPFMICGIVVFIISAGFLVIIGQEIAKNIPPATLVLGFLLLLYMGYHITKVYIVLQKIR